MRPGHKDDAMLMREAGVQPTAQRLAVASYVLHTDDHPTAEQVFAKCQGRSAMLSRATVYNTLNKFVKAGLLRALTLSEGKVVYDPNVIAHHHVIDVTNGAIYDVPWEAVRVSRYDKLPEYHVGEYTVTMYGRKRKPFEK